MKYQPHVVFSAQALVFRGLMRMFDRVRETEGEMDPYDVLPVVVFMAFTIEAYLNSIGARKIPLWPHLERQPWRRKIQILHEVTGKSTDWGAQPLQFATEIFGIRDQLAHGKPDTVPGPVLDCSETAISMLMVQHIKPPVLQGLGKEWVVSSSAKLYALLEYLGALFGLESDDFATYSSSFIKRHDEPPGPKA
jgi:hypothetical protein